MEFGKVIINANHTDSVRILRQVSIGNLARVNVKTCIENCIIKIEDVEWEKLSFLQKPTLKSIDKTQLGKLKESLKKNGYIQPCFVWENKEKIYCLDGYHRRLALLELRDEGHPVPSKLTGLFIQCKDIKDAAKKVLIYSSIYASVTDEGLYEFSHDFNIDFNSVKMELDFPRLNLEAYESGYIKDEGMSDGSGEKDAPRTIACPHCGHEFEYRESFTGEVIPIGRAANE